MKPQWIRDELFRSRPARPDEGPSRPGEVGGAVTRYLEVVSVNHVGHPPPYRETSAAGDSGPDAVDGAGPDHPGKQSRVQPRSPAAPPRRLLASRPARSAIPRRAGIETTTLGMDPSPTYERYLPS